LNSIWTHWHPHHEVLLGLGLLELAYFIGIGPLRKRYKLSDQADPRQTATFTVGVLVIFLSLVSPLHVLSDQYLFSAHMLQHVLLTLVAPPLLILGTPGWLLRRLMRPDLVFRTAKIVTHPVPAFVTFNLIFAMSHLPNLYNLSVTNHSLHVAEHLVFITTAVLMWFPIASTVAEIKRLPYPLQMVYLFLMSLAQVIVFAPITFSNVPLYQWYVDAPQIWSISTLVDQQIGGIIMKIGSGLIFMTLLIVVFFRWFEKEETNARSELSDVEYSYAE